jgi:hypothetical protein
MGATRNVGVAHGDQNFPGTTFFLARYSFFFFFGSHFLFSKRVSKKKNNFNAFHYASVRDAHANALALHFFSYHICGFILLSLISRVFGIFLIISCYRVSGPCFIFLRKQRTTCCILVSK